MVFIDLTRVWGFCSYSCPDLRWNNLPEVQMPDPEIQDRPTTDQGQLGRDVEGQQASGDQPSLK